MNIDFHAHAGLRLTVILSCNSKNNWA